MMKEPIVALLPIKAHSARVKGKNFRSFANRPLFYWILETLLAVPEVGRVVINTDARQLLAEQGLCESDRVVVRDRRPELCGDLVSMNRVIADDLEHVRSQVYLMTHTTNPLLSSATIQQALSVFFDAQGGGADSLFSVNRIQSRFYREDASPVNHDPNILLRTQDLEPWFEENSNLYIFTREGFASTRARIGRKPVLFETPRLESVDIDDQTGWNLAEIIALQRQLARVGKE